MKTISVAALLFVLSLAAAWANAADDEAVREVIRLFQADFNEGTFQNAPSYTTEDWEHIHSGGGITRGRDQVLSEVRSVHQSILKGVSMSMESMTIRYVTADVALVVALHNVSPHKSSSGEMHVGEQWLKTYIVVRRNGRWLLTHDHATTIEGSLSSEPTNGDSSKS